MKFFSCMFECEINRTEIAGFAIFTILHKILFFCLNILNCSTNTCFFLFCIFLFLFLFLFFSFKDFQYSPYSNKHVFLRTYIHWPCNTKKNKFLRFHRILNCSACQDVVHKSSFCYFLPKVFYILELTFITKKTFLF